MREKRASERGDMRVIYNILTTFISHAIRSKPNWMQKIHDVKIVKKWVEEAKAMGLVDKNASVV